MLPAIPDPELFFGFCSPVGVDNVKARDLLINCLKKYGYTSEYFKVTTLMKSIRPKDIELKETPLEDKYDSYIKYANRLREVTELDWGLSVLCCTAVRNFRRNEHVRRNEKPDPDVYIPKTAYIFDQFKREEEINVLRQIYSQLFVVISVYSEKKNRMERLISRIASDHSDARPSEEHASIAADLIKRDQHEEGALHGQRLEDAFSSADLFLNIDDPEGSEKLLTRFLDALFGSNAVSPTHDEYGIYAAQNAALRSLDLSRQVGAAIFSESNEVITFGCNEVPKALGGTYWTGDPGDARDMKKGSDSNERIKKSFLVDFTKRLSKAGFLKGEIKEMDVARFILKETDRGGSLRDAQVMDLLEFGRMIHAEMSAICDAARTGRTLKNAVLYCTTFPCHLCAKHIVAAGIKRVVYIEPFPKSYAEHLHGDAIVVGKSGDTGKIVFEPFIGISPHRYRALFARERRKDDAGNFQQWMEKEPRPIIRYTVTTYIQNENAIAKMFNSIVSSKVEAGLLEIVS